MASLDDRRASRKSFGAAEVLKDIDLRGRGRRVHRAGRPVGLRQVHPAGDDRRPRERQRRRDRDRRPRGQPRATQGPQHRHGVPVLRALPDDDRAAEHHLRHGVPERAEAPSRTRRSSGSRQLLQIEPSARPQAVAAVGRPAPAGRDGPGAGARPRAVPVRRAAVQPRRQAAGRDAHRDQEAAPAPRHHGRSMSPTTRSRR